MADSSESDPAGDPSDVVKSPEVLKKHGLPPGTTYGELHAKIAADAERIAMAKVKAVLDSTSNFLHTHVDVPLQYGDVVILWAAATHSFMDDQGVFYFRKFPFLAITSPTRGSGKTTLLDTLEFMVRDPLRVYTVTPYRLAVDSNAHTTMVDEVDSDPSRARSLTQVLNGSYEKNGTWRSGKNPPISTYGPKALSGNLPLPLDEATVSRTLLVHMFKSPPGSKKTLLPTVDPGIAPALTGVSGRLIEPHIAKWQSLAQATLLGAGIENRTFDNWFPLFTWAHAAGTVWVNRALRAMAFVETANPEETDAKLVVLRAIRKVFDDSSRAGLYTKYLVAKLNEQDEIVDLRMGLDQYRLARLLRDFKIRPQNRNFDPGIQGKGYMRVDFEMVWTNYGC